MPLCHGKCLERPGIRVVHGCERTGNHLPHDWYDRKAGRHVHCYGK